VDVLAAEEGGALRPTEPLAVGDRLRLLVTPGGAAGEVQLDVTVEHSGVEKRERTGVQVRGSSVRAVAMVRLGRVLKLELEKAPRRPARRVEIVVTELP